MNATRLRDLLGIAMAAGIVAWGLVRRFYGDMPQLTWFVPLSLGLLAFAEALAGINLRARIRGQRGLQPVNPLVAARSLALAKASSLVGAAMTGLWAGLLVYVAPQVGFLAQAGQDTLTATLGVVCSAGLVAAAMWLEYCCRTPKPPEERRGDRHGDSHRR